MGERLGNGAVRERWNDRRKVTGTTTIFIILKFHVLPTFTQSGNVRCYRRDTNSTKVSLLHDAMHDKWLELPNESSKIKAEILPNGYLGWLVFIIQKSFCCWYIFSIFISKKFLHQFYPAACINHFTVQFLACLQSKHAFLSYVQVNCENNVSWTKNFFHR